MPVSSQTMLSLCGEDRSGYERIVDDLGLGGDYSAMVLAQQKSHHGLSMRCHVPVFMFGAVKLPFKMPDGAQSCFVWAVPSKHMRYSRNLCKTLLRCAPLFFASIREQWGCDCVTTFGRHGHADALRLLQALGFVPDPLSDLMVSKDKADEFTMYRRTL